MENGVWFRLNVGRERKADPKWLLPEICRQGELTKKDVGAIRVFDTETLFQVDAGVAEKFAELVTTRAKGGVRIMRAPSQTGEPSAPRHAPERSDQPRENKPDFHRRKIGPQKFEGKKFEGKKFGKKKFGKHKPGGRKPES